MPRGRWRPGLSGAAGAEAARRDGGGGRGGGPYGRRQLEDAGAAGSHQAFRSDRSAPSRDGSAPPPRRRLSPALTALAPLFSLSRSPPSFASLPSPSLGRSSPTASRVTQRGPGRPEPLRPAAHLLPARAPSLGSPAWPGRAAPLCSRPSPGAEPLSPSHGVASPEFRLLEPTGPRRDGGGRVLDGTALGEAVSEGSAVVLFGGLADEGLKNEVPIFARCP